MFLLLGPILWTVRPRWIGNRSPEYAGDSNREEHATFISYTLSVRIDSRSDAASEVQTLAATTGSTSTSTSAARVLIFNGSGTGSSAVTAIENVVHSLGLAYQTVNSSQLDAMTQTKLASYKLFIVPGGNSIAIGNNLTVKATTTVRNADFAEWFELSWNVRWRLLWRIFQLPQSVEFDLGRMVQVFC